MKKHSPQPWPFAIVSVVALSIAACSSRGLLPTTVSQAAFSPTAQTEAHASERLTAPSAGHSTVWFDVVDDPSGAPLAHEPVALYPWVACKVEAGHALSCPEALQKTETNGAGHATIVNVPNGHYLLVIGSDSSTDLMHATVHDSVMLKGGLYHLIAPTMPPVPLYTPNPVELSGNYRIGTMSPSMETICFTAFNKGRAERHLPLVVTDQWLMENARAIVAFQRTRSWPAHTPEPENEWGYLTAGETNSVGGNVCDGAVDTYIFGSKYARDPQTLWFFERSQSFKWPGVSRQYRAAAEYPPDPRGSDPLDIPWP